MRFFLQERVKAQQTVRQKNQELKERLSLVCRERNDLQKAFDKSEDERVQLDARVRELERKLTQIEHEHQRQREEDHAKIREATRRVIQLERERDEAQVVVDVDPTAVVASQNDSGIDLVGFENYENLLSTAMEMVFEDNVVFDDTVFDGVQEVVTSVANVVEPV